MTDVVGPVAIESAVRRRPALLACLAAGFATLVDSSLLGIVTPALRESLDVSTSATQWILASYSLTFGLALVPAGRLGDMYGRRRLFLGGVLTFTAMSLVGGLAPVPWLIVLARLLQGVGAGVISSQVLGLIQDLFTGSARAKALGAYGVAGALSGLVGPILGAMLVTYTGTDAGWRLALMANIPFAVVALALGLRYVPQLPRSGARLTLDPLGLFFLAGTTLLMLLPIVWNGGPVIALLVLAAAFLGAFIWWERRYAATGRTPVLATALVRSGGYVRGTLVAMFWFGAVLAQGTALTLYVIVGLGQSALIAAVIVIPRSLGSMTVSAFSWRLLGRFGRLTVTAGIGVQLLGTLVIAAGAVTLEPVPFLWMLAGVELAMGIAHGASEAPNRALTFASVPTSASGVAAGFLQLSQRLCATITIAAATGIFLAADADRVSRTAAVGVAVLLTAGLLIASLTASIIEQRHRPTLGSDIR